MKLSILLVLILFSFPLLGQTLPKSLTAKFITDNIKIDGTMDEPVWQTAASTDYFWQFFPTDSAMAKHTTQVRVLYTEKTLYIGFYANAPNDNYVVSSLRRDFAGTGSDNVAVVFDTFSDGTNAFMFSASPYGVQREALVSGGQELNPSWDMKWHVETKMHPDHYTMEMAIPLTSIKFKEGADKWRFQTYRWNLQTNEQSAWSRVPRNQLLSSLAFMGELVFEKPLDKSVTPLAIIPYINGLTGKDFVAGKGSSDFKTGGDIKVSIGNSLNLDVTVNPDFSNVEVDNIVTNLTRFEVFLPEKRQFFTDNSDIFAHFGSPYRDASPFFSRRIGIARDAAGNSIQNDIIGGIRLSGKLNQDWRIGFLNLQTEADRSNNIASYNNMMLALQKKVFSRSNINFFAINRQSFEDYGFLKAKDSYNRVLGAEYNLASKTNVWTGEFYLHKSFQPGDNKGNFSSSANLTYNTRLYNIHTDVVQVDEDFRSDLGFIPRKDIFKMGNALQRFFYPQNSSISRHSIRLFSLAFWRPGLDFKLADHTARVSWLAEFKNQATLDLRAENLYTFLTNSFDPTSTPGAVPLPGNKGYSYKQATAIYISNPAKKLYFTAQSTIGEFYTGQRLNLGGELSLRKQPWALISLAVNYDRVRLPNPHSDAGIWLVSPKADITFSKALFWSTLVQYSNQRDNIGVNTRLQWRYAPLSDLFLVYNDNYFTRDFGPRFRSINLKLTYWLNL
jgi:hypothetical protein